MNYRIKCYKSCSRYNSLVLVMVLAWSLIQSCEGSISFGFDIHHRFSDPVKAMFSKNSGDDELPVKGTMEYYAAMVHRDRVHGRRLTGNTANNGTPPLTFYAGNATYNVANWGYIYYANVSVGTPEAWYLVALDTGSGVFWLPCDCAPICVSGYQGGESETIQFNIYSLSTSSTGSQLSCTSPFCTRSLSCSPSQPHCSYRVDYLSANTSSSGYLVQDVMHLATDASTSTAIDSDITFGCGIVQTGTFLTSGAPNGLLGLSMDPMSLPNVLASQNLIANSFSMCFSTDNIGRISFGDKGSNKQSETPINLNQLVFYNVSITQVTVGSDTSAADFSAIFDTGTSFTLLSDPAYTLITGKFDSQVQDKRVTIQSNDAFEFCYGTSSSPSDLITPVINFTMVGGDQFSVQRPWLIIATAGDLNIYCLAMTKSDQVQNINIIGENFMSGYRIVFDNEKMILGWKQTDCGEAVGFAPDLPAPVYGQGGSGSPSSLDNSYLAIAIVLVGLLTILLNSSLY